MWLRLTLNPILPKLVLDNRQLPFIFVFCSHIPPWWILLLFVSLYITKRSEAVLQWGKRKNIKKMMINGELVIEWKKEKTIKDVVVENICYD